jgi:hypothetical protein
MTGRARFSGEVMPKQRNHPHHHNAVERARRLRGLRQPQPRWGARGPYFLYPPGWVTRRPWNGVLGAYLVYIVAAVIVLAVIFACIGGIMLWQALIGPR